MRPVYRRRYINLPLVKTWSKTSQPLNRPSEPSDEPSESSLTIGGPSESSLTSVLSSHALWCRLMLSRLWPSGILGSSGVQTWSRLALRLALLTPGLPLSLSLPASLLWLGTADACHVQSPPGRLWAEDAPVTGRFRAGGRSVQTEYLSLQFGWICKKWMNLCCKMLKLLFICFLKILQYSCWSVLKATAIFLSSI